MSERNLTLKTPAKVNLTLDVTGKRADGYHEIETIFQTISLYDTVTLTLSDTAGDITLDCDTPNVPCDERNLAWKAAARFREATGSERGVHIHLEKFIPSEAGLGGGSSDGAAVLYGLNVLHGEPLTREELCAIGAKMGADVPFFLYGGTAYAAGIGEQLSALPALSGISMVIAKGSSGISTAAAYRAIDALTEHPVIQTRKLCDAVSAGQVTENDLSALADCGNLFEMVTDLADVANIRDAMKAMGAVASCMSGSGSSVFGIFKSHEDAEACAAALKEQYAFAAACEMTATSFLTLE